MTKTDPPSIEDALALALSFHAGQKDRSGSPYILHLCRVMLKFKAVELRIIALLHDIIEDTEVTLERLLDLGYHPLLVAAIDTLTRRPNEDYDCYIERCNNNVNARMVKIVDLEDHLRHSNEGGLPFDMVLRYMNAYKRLTGYWPLETVL